MFLTAAATIFRAAGRISAQGALLLERALAPYGLRRVRASQVADFLLSPKDRAWGNTTFEGQVRGYRLVAQTQARFVDMGQMGRWGAVDAQKAAQAHKVRLVIDAVLDRAPSVHIHFGHDLDILGDEVLAAAILNGEMRAATRHGDRLSLEDGRVVLEAEALLADRDPVRVVESLANLAHRLAGAFADDRHAGRVDLIGLLAENAQEDANPDVRSHAVDVLFRRFPTDVRAAEIAERALKDSDPRVRLTAARYVGERGFDVLAAIILHETTYEATQQAALRYLCRSFSVERVAPVLTDALYHSADQVQGAAIQKLGELRYRPAAKKLIELASSASFENTARIASALTAICGHRAEPTLIRMLKVKPNPPSTMPRQVRDAKIEIIDALGRVGTSVAVQFILPFSDPLVAGEDLKIAADTAIELIQGRAGDSVQGGSLSLIEQDDELGLLSLPRTPAGALSSAELNHPKSN